MTTHKCGKGLRLAKQQFCTCNHALLNISLQPLHDCDVKISTFTVYEEPEHEKTGERTSERTNSSRIQLQKNSPTFDKLNEME